MNINEMTTLETTPETLPVPELELRAYEDWCLRGVTVKVPSNLLVETDHHGFIHLSWEEALKLAAQLVTAAQEAARLDLDYRDYIIDEAAPKQLPECSTPVVYMASIEDIFND